MLYKNRTNSESPLDMGLFKNPSKEYRGAPFWAWNCQIDKTKLDKQISCFKEMGFGGYHMHPRQGMATEYLSDDFMDYISFCIENGKEKNMYSYLYDEDRWPSGYAGGLVTKEPKFRQRILIVTKNSDFLTSIESDALVAFTEGLPYMVGCYDIEFDKAGFLMGYKKIEVSDIAEHEKYYAYSKTFDLESRYNFQTPVDIMQPEAIERFIELTHKRYYNAFGHEYQKAIPSIFTDEPRHKPLEQMSETNPESGASYYWTYNFDESFQKKYGYSLVERLPYLIWDTADGAHCYVRYHFFNHAEDLFENAFFKQISEITKKENLAFTGHLMGEHFLVGQLNSTGDAMRLYPYFDIPGIDVLFDRVELSTAKQTQSIVRQYGKKAMLSELYGVTGWDFDFKCLKMQGDWQAALGVTFRVPHLSMMSMAGRAKRDYPASFNYQSPWYQEYKYVEDHFARLNTVLSRGKSVANVAVLHPMETTMLRYSTKEKSAALLEQQEENFQNIINWLLYSAIDFDFLNEALLPTQDISYDKKLGVGQMEYDVVIIPPIDTIRESTIEILECFSKHGGKIIFTDKSPQYVDGRKSDRAKQLYNASIHSGMNKTDLTELLAEERMVYLQNADGTDTNDLIYQLREDCDCLWLFVAYAKKMGKTSYERSALTARNIVVTVKGEYNVLNFDTVSGEIKAVEYSIHDGKTAVNYDLFANDSLLLKLTKEEVQTVCPEKENKKMGEITLWDEVSFKRSEPNVVLLDVGRYSLEGKTYGNKEYVLEMNQQLAEVFDITYSDAQPYILKENQETHKVYVRFEFESEFEMDGVSLAAERVEECSVILNGISVDCAVTGYYVDESIKTIQLPKVKKGKNVLDIRMPFSESANIEPCYLLGEFDVTLKGCNATIHKPSDKVGFAPLANQGMPFYGGNITYSTEICTPECKVRITVSDFGAHCVRAFVDGEDAGLIAFAPFAVEKNLSAGKHRLEFLCYGNRNNTFGPVHNKRMKDMDYYIEPSAWEKDCEFWRSGYFLQDTGVLSGPVIELFETDSMGEALKLLLQNNPNQKHPRILMEEKQFSEIRNALGSEEGNPFYKHVATNVIKEADSYMSLPVIAYELRDGLRLLECSRDILARTGALGMAYQLTAETKYAERAWLEMQNAACFEDWNPYHFLDTAEMALAIATGYDWIYDWMTDSQRKLIRDAIFQKAILPLFDDYDQKPRRRTWDWLHKPGVVNNWRFVCNGGVAVATLAIADELEEDEQKLAGRVLAESLIHIEDALKLFAPTGAYNEGMAYWEYAMKYLAAHMRSYEICLGTDFHYFETQGIYHTPYFVYAVNGSVGVFNYHDCDIYSRHIPPEIMYIADRFDDYAMALPRIDQVFSKNEGTVRDLIYYRPEFDVAKAEELQGDFYFPEIEVVSMRCGYGLDDTYVGMHCGSNYCGDSHDHMDLGVFVLDALGEQFFIELGKDDYTLPHYYRDVYRFRAEGHNTIILNPATWDSGQHYGAYAKIDEHQFGKEMSFAISDLTDAFADYALSVKRGIRLNKRTQNVVVQDEIHLRETSDLWWFAHTGADVCISADGKTAQLCKNGKKLHVRLCGNDEASFSVMDAVPLATSPQVEGQDRNEGIRKLVIHIPECKDAVLCVIIEVTQGTEEIVPLDEWKRIVA